MSPLTLYVDGYFTNVWDASCFVALTEKHLDFAIARALLHEGSVPQAMRDVAWIRRIPALQHGDFWLTESPAIVEYLEAAFPAPDFTRVLPAEPRTRARARQIMMWLRADTIALREERPWQRAVYPAPVAPLSPSAEREAEELVALAARLAGSGELGDWSIAHVDLALALMRIADEPMPDGVRAFLDTNLARPSLRAYIDHARPPNAPPRARS